MKPFWGKRRERFRIRRGSFYRNMLVAMLLFASAPGLLVAVGMYVFGIAEVERELQRAHERQLLPMADNVREQLGFVEMIAANRAQDPLFDQRLRSLDFVYGYELVNALFKQLLIMENAHPLIQRVELLLSDPEYWLLRDRYDPLTDPLQILQYEPFVLSKKSCFGARVRGWLSFINCAGGGIRPYGASIFYINEEKLNGMLNALIPYERGVAFLFDPSGQWMTGIDETGACSELKYALWSRLRSLPDHEADKGSFLYKWQGVTYSVSYESMRRLSSEWMLVSAVPVSAVIAPVARLSRWLFLISFAGLVLTVGSSWFTLNRLYSLLQKFTQKIRELRGCHEGENELELIENDWHLLNQERQALQVRLNRQIPVLRESFVRQLIQGHLSGYREQELREHFANYGLEANGRWFVLMYVRLADVTESKRFRPGDEELLTFAACNIAEELAGKRADQYLILNFHDCSFGLLLSFPESKQTTVFQQTRRLGEEMSDAITGILRVRTRIGVSNAESDLEKLHKLYEQAQRAVLYQSVTGDNQMIEYREIEENDPVFELTYPFRAEKDLIVAFRSGSVEEADRQLGRFLEELTQADNKQFSIQQGMLQLLGSLLRTMLELGMNPALLFKGVNLYEEMQRRKEPVEMKSFLSSEVIRPVCRMLRDRLDARAKEATERAIGYLNENFAEELSLEQLADRFDISPYTLSRMFKQLSGITFVDYITELRLDKAKELLRETELPIQDVAAQVGYRQNYFARLFKKREGVTPTRYRETFRERSNKIGEEVTYHDG